MTFQHLSEAFIRRSWYSVLLVLDMAGRCHVKKAVVGVTELIAALVTIHSVLAFLTDMYCLFDPPGKVLRLPVDHHLFGPVYHVVLLSHVVSEGGFVVFWYPQYGTLDFETRQEVLAEVCFLAFVNLVSEEPSLNVLTLTVSRSNNVQWCKVWSILTRLHS